jgi:hypothetical protein
MKTPIQAGKDIKRIITFEMNSMGEPMPVVIYKKKIAAPSQPVGSLAVATSNAKSIFEKVVDSQIQAASEFKTLNEQAGADWLKQIGKNISLAIVKGGTAFETK